jgi:hypothetical protein
MADQFEKADQAIDKAARSIAQRIRSDVGRLLKTTSNYDVATDYVVERLVSVLLKQNPEVLDWLDRQPGDGSVKLSNALHDWRDLWSAR